MNSIGGLATITILTFLMVSCTSKQPVNNTLHTVGSAIRPILHVDVDEGLKSVIEQQKEVFEYVYDSIKLDIGYRKESDIFEDFRHKKTAVVIISRTLSDADKESFKNRDTLYTQEVRVAYDAIAVIGNKHFDDSKLDIETLKGYLHHESPVGVNMVFEQNSSIVNYVLGLLDSTKTMSSSAFALRSAGEVIDYVEKNNNAIGFIPYNYLGDINEERVKSVLRKIKVLSLRSKSRDGQVIRASANQSDIAEGNYPLMRIINVVTRYSYDNNDARLLVDFLFKERGARIFLKAGLIPVQTPERIINVNTGELKRAEQ